VTSGKKFVTDPKALLARLAKARKAGRKIVLTNGTFDLLHVGHIRFLEAARKLGDFLLVAVNSDASVRGYKGPGRPLIPEQERALVVAALECVDLVTIFEETTAHALLQRVQPEVYAKGCDYGPGSLPEEALARKLGAAIAFVGDKKTHAASSILDRMRRLLEARET